MPRPQPGLRWSRQVSEGYQGLLTQDWENAGEGPGESVVKLRSDGAGGQGKSVLGRGGGVCQGPATDSRTCSRICVIPGKKWTDRIC